jgi:putative sugar O-methyltransferase
MANECLESGDRFKDIPFFGPMEGHSLSKGDFIRCCEVCDRISFLRSERSAYLSNRRLDPAVYLPANLWAQDFCPTNFSTILRKDYRVLNNLRFFTYNFTGFRLLEGMPALEEFPPLTELPEDYDQIVRKHAHKTQNLIEGHIRNAQLLPRECVVMAPRIFGECGWDVAGALVNKDIWATQCRINALYCSGIIDYLKRIVRERGYCKIMEIGAGYGNLVPALWRATGAVEYTIVDLPESIIYSSLYVSTVLAAINHMIAEPGTTLPDPGPGVRYLCNHMFEEFAPQLGQVDLVINALSFSEMSPPQVDFYARHISRMIGRHGLFFEQNYHTPIHIDIASILSQHLGYNRILKETTLPHTGRGLARIWTNGYVCEVFDVLDTVARNIKVKNLM